MAWYNASWTYRQKITVDATQVDEVFSLLPIYTSKLNRHFHDNAKAAAADIRITRADGTTEVARYIVAHDATARTGCIIANVSADVSISTNTDYYVYYGNAAASDHAVTDTYGRNAVFADYAGFYLPGMSTADLTGAGRTLTAVNSPTTDTSGYEGITAAKYNGSTQYHSYSGTQARATWPITLESLAYSTATTADQVLISYSLASSNNNYAEIYLNGASTDGVAAAFKGPSGSTSTATTSTDYSSATWHFAAGTRSTDAGTSIGYIDGGNSGSESTTISAPTAFDRLTIGALHLNVGVVAHLNGRVAMAALSSSVRSADYIATMYDAWNSSTFFTAGAIETATGGMTGWRLFQTAATTTASGSDQDWTNPNNAYSVNADAATSVLDEATWLQSETLKLTNPDYGITIPSGHTTYGCAFKVLRSGQTNSAKEIRDKLIKFIDNTGAVVGTDMKAGSPPIWPSTAAAVDYTGAGVTFTDAKFTSSSGLAIQADGSGSNGATTASVVTAWMNVTWDTPAGGAAVGSFFYM